jgi:hypothetical protein
VDGGAGSRPAATSGATGSPGSPGPSGPRASSGQARSSDDAS